MYSLIVPVYKNESTIDGLFKQLEAIGASRGDLEVVFVIDGSPDRSAEKIEARIKGSEFAATVVRLSRNFGSFPAIKAGLQVATGPYFAVMAADCQEPPELIIEFFDVLSKDQCDVVVGTRQSRNDPLGAKMSGGLFWFLYRKLIQREVPPGGVDVFGCNLLFRDQLVSLSESHSSLIGQVFWLGFRRLAIPYSRKQRDHGRSAWTLRKKVRYLSDSFFSFSDLPIKFLIFLGVVGFSVAAFFAAWVLLAKITGRIDVPGYTTIVIIVSLFASINSLGFGIVGHYVWRTFENTKNRPASLIQSTKKFPSNERQL